MLHKYMIFLITVYPCCDKIILNGNEDLKQLHGDKLGIYEKTTNSHGSGQIFKLTGKEYYLFRSHSMHWTVRLMGY